MELTSEMAQRICPDVVRGIHRRGDRTFVTTSFQYPDGETLCLYFEQDEHGVHVSDRGNTRFKMEVNSVSVSAERQHLINQVCAQYGLQADERRFSRLVNPETVGTDCIMFCEAITRISSLIIKPLPTTKGVFAKSLDRLVSSSIEIDTHVHRGWTISNSQFDRINPVDYRFGESDPKHLFYVNSRTKCNLVPSVISYLRDRQADAPTMVIVDPEAHLGKMYRDRLNYACRQVWTGLEDNQSRIRDFALSRTG